MIPITQHLIKKDSRRHDDEDVFLFWLDLDFMLVDSIRFDSIRKREALIILVVEYSVCAQIEIGTNRPGMACVLPPIIIIIKRYIT
jgi:hypothetical protein